MRYGLPARKASMMPLNRAAAHNALLRGVLHDGPSTSLVPVWPGRPQQPTPKSFSFFFVLCCFFSTVLCNSSSDECSKHANSSPSSVTQIVIVTVDTKICRVRVRITQFALSCQIAKHNLRQDKVNRDSSVTGEWWVFRCVFEVTRIFTSINKCFYVCTTQFEDFYCIPNQKGISQNQILCLLHAGSFLFDLFPSFRWTCPHMRACCFWSTSVMISNSILLTTDFYRAQLYLSRQEDWDGLDITTCNS